jgi:hypothetical protein
MLDERGYRLDETATAQAWGASFDGCVTKYSLIFRRLLGLKSAVEIVFGLTTPDAAFLLDIAECDTVLLNDKLRLFIFRLPEGAIALYTATSHSLADRPAMVRIDIDPGAVTVKSKQGIRLWPEPEPYHLPTAPAGCYEPPQQVVKLDNGALCVPVSAGFVYRLAKAPAYIFSPPDMPYDSFRQVLIKAETVEQVRNRSHNA